MTSGNIHIELDAGLRDHIRKQIGDERRYRDASEYVDALIRQDMQSDIQASEWLSAHLEPAMQAEESEFSPVSAEEVIRRNQHR